DRYSFTDLLLLSNRRWPKSTLFPSRRSSDLEPRPICWKPMSPSIGSTANCPPAAPEITSWSRDASVDREDGTNRFLIQPIAAPRSEEHTSELQSRGQLVCRLLLEKTKQPL